jgi:hypothetical protein
MLPFRVRTALVASHVHDGHVLGSVELCNTMRSTPRRHGGVDDVDKTLLLFSSDRGWVGEGRGGALLFNGDRGGGGGVNPGE